MCGIAGLYWKSNKPDPEVSIDFVHWMNAKMMHRGPDGDGIWVSSDGRCALGHRRLSIIDLSKTGHQPMVSNNGRWVLSFNGEIYNFKELRTKLEKCYAFSGRSDTEVLLAAIQEWGTAAIERLDGMFSFAAYDTLTQQLILGRDPFGEKPLYYFQASNGALAFASELHCLETLPFFQNEISVDAIGELLAFQYIGAPRTIYKDVNKLPPGHWMVVNGNSEIKVQRYFSFEPTGDEYADRSMDDLADELEDILVRMLKRRTISDVPLGAFLSGGVDSSLACALIRKKLKQPLRTFSIGFSNHEESEHLIARQLADHIGTDHNDQILTPSSSDFLNNIGKILDEPNADSSCLPTYILSKYTREFVTVAISGDGGDELFGGYGRYATILEKETKRLNKVGESYYSDPILIFTDKYLREIFSGCLPTGLWHHLNSLRSEITNSTLPLIHRLRQSDQVNYMPGAVLPKVDRMSMQHSLEVRTPYLSVEMARFAEKLAPHQLIADGKAKVLLRHLAYRYLPPEIMNLPKKGFGLPLSDWARTQQLPIIQRLLATDDCRLRAILGDKGIDDFLVRQNAPNGFSAYQAWAVMVLEGWLRERSISYTPMAINKKSPVLTWISQPYVYMVDIMNEFSHASYPSHAEFHTIVSDPKSQHYNEIIPDWHEDLAWVKKITSGKFKDKIIVADHSAFMKNLDATVLEDIRLSGARELHMPHSFNPGTWVRFIFNSHQPLRTDKTLIKKLKSVGVDVIEFKTVWHKRWRKKHNFKLADNSGLTEAAAQYFVFEDGKMLPSIPDTHERIKNQCKGKYSIWNGNFMVARSSSYISPLHPSKYELIKSTEKTRDIVPFWMDTYFIEDKTEVNAFRSAIRLLIKQLPSSPDNEPFPKNKIGLFTCSLQSGGAERQWCYLARSLRKQGYDVYFFFQEKLDGSHAHYRYMLRNTGCHIIELNRCANVIWLRELLSKPSENATAERLFMKLPLGRYILSLSYLLKFYQINTLYCQLDSPNIVGGCAGLMSNLDNIVLSFRNYNPSNFDYISNSYNQICYAELSKTERIMMSGNSKACNEDYARWIGISPENVTYIPNAIDVFTLDHTGTDDSSKDSELFSNNKVILGVFRLSPEKRPFDFIKICIEVIELNHDTHAAIIGSGPLYDVLLAEIKASGYNERIHLIGAKTNVFHFMKKSSMLLLTSEREGTPNVLLEAMAAGLPTVATNTGGVPDLIEDQVTGFVHDVGDIKGMSKSCLQLLDNPEKSAEIASKAKEKVQQDHNIDALGNNHLQLVKQKYTATHLC